jgi:hypothetical protein
MNETEINAKFGVLIEQRNSALNQVVNLYGELSVANEKIKELTAQIPEKTAEEENTHA